MRGRALRTSATSWLPLISGITTSVDGGAIGDALVQDPERFAARSSDEHLVAECAENSRPQRAEGIIIFCEKNRLAAAGSFTVVWRDDH